MGLNKLLGGGVYSVPDIGDIVGDEGGDVLKIEFDEVGVCGSIRDNIAERTRKHRESLPSSVQGIVGGSSEVIEGCETSLEIFKITQIFDEIEQDILGFVYKFDEIKRILIKICLKYDLYFEEIKEDLVVMPDGFVLEFFVLDKINRFGIKLDESRAKLFLFELA